VLSNIHIAETQNIFFAVYFKERFTGHLWHNLKKQTWGLCINQKYEWS